MWNLISDLIALKQDSVEFFLSRIRLLDAQQRTQEIILKMLLNKGMKKLKLQFKSAFEQPGPQIEIYPVDNVFWSSNNQGHRLRTKSN